MSYFRNERTISLPDALWTILSGKSHKAHLAESGMKSMMRDEGIRKIDLDYFPGGEPSPLA